MNPTIIRLSAQALFGRRRGLVLVLIPLVLVGLAVLVRLLAGGDDGYDSVVNLGYTLALPLVALLAASAVLGPEVDDGSIVYLLAKPVSRHVIAVSKFVVAWLATLVLGALPLAIAGLVLDAGDVARALAWGAGAAVAGTAYTALFLVLAAMTRHAVVAGLLFVLIWEGVLGGLLAGIRWVAIGSWGRQVASEISSRVEDADLALPYAVGAALVVTLAALWVTGDRLRSFTLRGDE
ncbi:MAG: ABC transporter permease subunit [Tetrasphaera sp.]